MLTPAQILKRYPKVGHLAGTDLDDVALGGLVASLMCADLKIVHGYTRKSGRAKFPIGATATEIAVSYEFVTGGILAWMAGGPLARRSPRRSE